MTVRDVVVIGAGPVGLLVSGELARRGLDVELLDRRWEAGAGSRAIGVHAPVLAALESVGITEQLLAEAVRVSRGEARSGGRTLGVVHFDRLSTRFPFVATLPQAASESVFARAAPQPLWGAKATALRPRPDLVRVLATIQGRPIELAARLVVVAAGAGGRDLVYRSGAVRGRKYRDRYLMTDATTGPRADDELAVVHLDRSGVLESFPLPGGRRRFVAWDRSPATDSPDARVARLRRALRARGEVDAAEHVDDATAFGVRRFVAPRLRNDRVFVIGDAAHEVSPIGGQGMNLGLLDATGLAPLLAKWLRTGRSPDHDLRAWELRRVASAERAARLAAVNTGLGRPRGMMTDAARRVAMRAALSAPTRGVLARAYAMGFDLGA